MWPLTIPTPSRSIRPRAPEAPKHPGGPARIAGALLLAQRRSMERIAGRSAIECALAKLPPDVREEYEAIGLFSWCRQSTAREVTTAIAHEIGRAPVGFVAEVVRTGVEHTFRGPWKVLLGLASDEALVRRAALIFSKTCNVGTCSAELLAPGRARVRIDGWENANDLDVLSFAAGLEAILIAAGRSKARVSWTVGSQSVEYVVTTEAA